MPRMVIALQTSDGRTLHQDVLELDSRTLAAPVLAAGRDWLALTRSVQRELTGFAAWRQVGAAEAVLRVVLREEGGREAWSGSVPEEEVRRIARRSARALMSSGAWPQKTGGELRFAVFLEDAESELRPLAPTPAPSSTSGIELGAPVRAPATLPRVVGPDHVLDASPLREDEAPEIVVVFAPATWEAIRGLCRESRHASEERALVLEGERHAWTAKGDELLPSFWMTSARRPAVVSASATHLVLEHAPLAGEGAPAMALLHTHLSGVGLEASDNDRRDLEDLNAGGPGALSLIFEASSGPRPSFAVWARLGAREGHVVRARVLALVGTLRPGGVPKRPSARNDERCCRSKR